MIHGVSFTAYQNIARINSTVERIIVEASQTRNRVNSEMYSLVTGLGKNVDILV